jgi:hypothetical protein
MAQKAPLASMSTSVAVKCGDAVLPAGDYSVFFTIDEDLVWSINFAGKDDKVHSVKLQLADSGHESKRLLLCLYAEEEGAGVYVSFGKQAGMLTFVPHDGDDK